MRPEHLASGDINIERSVIPATDEGVDITVAKMMEMAKGIYGMRSPKIRALAINLANQSNAADKDYFAMAEAVHNWVRDHIRYVKDPIGQETLSHPEETAFNSMAGDCLAENTRLLTPAGYAAIKDVRPGDIVQGRKGWTKVTKVWDKGALPVRAYHLDNGGEFVATDKHRCFLQDGREVLAASLRTGDALLGPAAIELPEQRGNLSENDCYFIGLFLADGWADGNKVCLSGKDGFAKEAQKHWAKAYAEGLGWATNWQPRYISIYIPKGDPLYDFFHSGRLAPEKAIPACVLAELTPKKLRRLLDGLLADSYEPLKSRRSLEAASKRKRQTRSGACYSTTSPELAKQVRLLFRLTGVSVSDTLVTEHGGLGTHAIHRIYPRYFRPKPAKLEEVTEAGVAHCYDIATADQGIYLPDADVVVHNCDDKTILEIALLGSVGILAYPVVIGLDPRSYSHVYLHIVLPKGKYPNAGKTLAADPIMREWPLGKEAPADKVKRKKIFPHLLSGLGMLGTYASGPSYLDEENTRSVQPALDRGYVSAGRDQQGDGGVQAREVETEGLDNMFGGANAERILARGPMTAAQATNSTHRLGTRHKTVTADGDFDARPDISMVGSKDPGAPSDEELDVISRVIDEVAAENAPYENVGGLLGAADPVHKAAAVAHYAALKAARAVRRARRAPGAQTLALANKAAAIANKAHAKALKATASSPARRSALVSGMHLLNGTMGLLGDMADCNPCSQNPLVETRRTVIGLAASLPGLAGMAGPEDERLARLGMAQGANVLFGMDGLGLDLERQFAGVGDMDAPEGSIRRNGTRISASKTVYKGATRMLAAKRCSANEGADSENSEAQPKRRAMRARRAAPIWAPSFPARDESLLSRPTDSPEGYDAAGSAPPSYAHGPEQMGPLEPDGSALGPIEEPRIVDAVVTEDDVPGTLVSSTEDQPAQIEGWDDPAKIGAVAGGVAVLGLLAYFLLRKKK